MSGLTIKVITTGTYRSGISAKQKPYFMCEAYAQLPGVPYPQKITYYAAAQNEVRPAGEYECDVILSVKDERITIEVDPRQGRTISTAPAQVAPLKSHAQS
jgi:hypothetical protein